MSGTGICHGPDRTGRSMALETVRPGPGRVKGKAGRFAGGDTLR